MTEKEKAIKRVELLNQEAFEALATDIAEVERCAIEAKALAEKIGNEEGVSVSLLRLAEVDIVHAKFQDALGKVEEALVIARRLHLQEKEADALNLIAKINYIESDYSQSLRYLEQATLKKVAFFSRLSKQCGVCEKQCILVKGLSQKTHDI